MSALQLCNYLWLALLVVWAVWALGTRQTQTRESLASRLSYSVATVCGFYLALSTDVPVTWLRTRLFAVHPSVEFLGIALTAVGVGFSIWARVYLGGNWSGSVTVKVGHQLVRTGPYRWVRHPIYTGFLLGLLGTALVRAQVRGFGGVVVLYVGLKMKSKIEERTMAGVFGAHYEDYSRSTGAIVPRLI
jgi:protein-S-isoprenylcysteine O-methyltransferase Ste14